MTSLTQHTKWVQHLWHDKQGAWLPPRSCTRHGIIPAACCSATQLWMVALDGCRLKSAAVSLLQATIGIDFLSKTMYLEDRTVRLQLW